ncbi:MAG: hypothetical protein AAGC55_19550, partial [Myxococcota bacterium]
MPDREVNADTAEPLRRECEERIDAADRQIVTLDRIVATAGHRRDEHERMLAALGELCGAPVSAQDAQGRARQELRALRDLDRLVAELAELPDRLDAARARAAEQHKTRRQAVHLSLPDEPLASVQDVRAAFARADEELEAVRRAQTSERASLAEAESAAGRARDALAELEALVPRWRDVQDTAARLREAWRPAEPLASRGDVAALQELLHGEHGQLRERGRAARARLDALTERVQQLEHGGGEFGDALLKARDAVDGELLAGYFDDISVDQAGRVQAYLGPLAEAIVVDDARLAAQQLAGQPERPATVWLVDEHTRVAALRGDVDGAGISCIEDAVLVPSSEGTRLTTVPAHPTLGRRARAQRVAALRREMAAVEREIDQVTSAERNVGAALAATTALLGEVALLERRDPGPELRDVDKDLAAATDRARCHDSELARLAQHIANSAARRDAVRELLAGAHLLDLPDQAVVQRALEPRLSEARAARARLGQVARARRTVEDGLDILRVPPPTEDELTALRDQLAEARRQRDQLGAGISALEQRDLAEQGGGRRQRRTD